MSQKVGSFDVRAHLETTDAAFKEVTVNAGETIFRQGAPSDAVWYMESGTAKLSVISTQGKEAIVAMLGPGDFVGEGALTGQPVRLGSANSVTTSTLLVLETNEVERLIQTDPAWAEYFLHYVLDRNVRVEADLVDQLFNSSEKRLARTLLLLARFGKEEAPHHVLPSISQETLAEMVGTTRSRVNFFMNKFRKLGFVDYNGELRVNNSLMSVVLHD